LRRLTVALLVAGLCLMGVIPGLAQKIYSTLAEYEKLTGNKIEKFNEAPILKTRVAAGELPPVEERLPEEPMVVEPKDVIGEYGGELRTAIIGFTGWMDTSMRVQGLFKVSPDLKLETISPNIAKDWDFSEDYKTLTVYLRKGMRWSDGAPFTADDILFWYKDILLNDELTPVKPRTWCPGGELMKVEKVNDYAVRFQFAIAHPPAVATLATGQNPPFAPMHYLRKYHVKYNPEANEIAKKEGYDYWWQCFNFHSMGSKTQQDLDFPTLNTWILRKIDDYQNRYYERNPYYWKIDTTGNQLPYIDEQIVYQVANTEVANLKAIAGELSLAGQRLSIENYPLYKKNEKKGNYRVMLWAEPYGTKLGYVFNFTHKDPVLRKIFRDIRFRQAMSLAINRDEINKTLFFGKAIPRQATTLPETSFYEPWMGEQYTKYDPEHANRLLDEMGLKWDKRHQYRLRPDGKQLAITIEYAPPSPIWGRIHELVKDYWEKVGVKVTVKEIDRSLIWVRLDANELDVGSWHFDNITEFAMYKNDPLAGRPFIMPLWLGGVEWLNWMRTNGKTGEEPPEAIKRFYKLVNEWRTTVPGTEKYMRLGKEFLTIREKNLIAIGTVGMSPAPVIVKNNLQNLPQEAVLGGVEWNFLEPYQAEQWFFKK